MSASVATLLSSWTTAGTVPNIRQHCDEELETVATRKMRPGHERNTMSRAVSDVAIPERRQRRHRLPAARR